MKRLAVPGTALLVFLPLACSDTVDPNDAGVVPDVIPDAGPTRLGLSPSVAYEGQRRFVAQLSSALGSDDLSQATVTPVDSASGVVIDQTVCTRLRCAIVAHLEDVVPNRGSAVPAAIDGRRVDLVTQGRLYRYTSTMTVIPLDRADARTSAAGRIANLAIYSSLEVPGGLTLRPQEPEQPVRVVVFGGVSVRGTIDLSPDESNTPTAGGGAGGASPNGSGGAMGGVGSDAAGGGGGFAEAGGRGTGSDGAPAGAGGAVRGDDALWPLVGGAGGGGSRSGVGGAGGGTVLLVGFHGVDLEGASFVSRGGAGRGSGGGGSGGGVYLAGAALEGRYSVDVSGGRGGSAGGATGGAGSFGRVRIDSVSTGTVTVVGPSGAAGGASFDLTMIPPVVRTSAVALRGRGTPGATVHVEDRLALSAPYPSTTATVGPDGTWTATLNLPAQGNPARLVLTERRPGRSEPAPSFSGSTLITRVEGPNLLFEGAALDLVYLPMRD